MNGIQVLYRSQCADRVPDLSSTAANGIATGYRETSPAAIVGSEQRLSGRPDTARARIGSV